MYAKNMLFDKSKKKYSERFLAFLKSLTPFTGELVGSEIIPIIDGENVLTLTAEQLLSSAGEGNTPDYYEYEAFVAQSGTSNPIITVLKNTTGYTVNWSRSGVGDCRCVFSGTSGYSNGARKSLYVSNAGNMVDMDPKVVLAFGKWTDTEFRLTCYRESGGNLALADGFWAHVYMRVYYANVPGG